MNRILYIAFCIFILSSCKTESEKPATSSNPKIDKLKVPDGFKVEHLYSPSEKMQGSWVSMTFDDKGRLIASDQYGALYRIEVTPLGTDSLARIEKLNIGSPADTSTIQMGFAQGLLYAFNSLYVMVNNYQNEEFKLHSGLYRLQDTNNDDQYDKITVLKEMDGAGEHGPHSVILSPDKKSIYVIAGNHTDLPKMNSFLLPPVWQEDNLFPLIKDPRGHANDRYAPGGWIARTDSVGGHWELVSAGYRNAFDIAFNEDAELFTYDSDMEWDFGMPWYRPIRICHVTSGSEYGWRTGNSKWSPSFPDNLPPVINIGQGSPTNLVHGIHSKFPEKYRDALFAFDWSFGIIYALHLKANGSTYSAEPEEFLSGSPLPLTDGVFGPDGALYFVTGGRRLESDLYRIYFDSGSATNVSNAKNISDNSERDLRKQLEKYHHNVGKEAVDFAWVSLSHEDRVIRYAARIVIEHQPMALWQDRALREKDPTALIQAMIAMAHHGKANVKQGMIGALTSLKFSDLDESSKADLLRAIELFVLRMGKLNSVETAKLVAYLEPNYPATSNLVNRGLSKLLAKLESPLVVQKTIPLLETAKDDPDEKTASQSSDLILRNPQYGMDIASMLSKIPPAQQTYYATVLMNTKSGWTPELRERYFTWFRNAFNYKGGLSYIGFINKAREAALRNVPKDKFEYYNKLSGQELLSQSGIDLVTVEAKGPWREWSLEEALSAVENNSGNADLENGKQMFEAARCKSCHIFKGEGGVIGPDLTQLGTRFTTKDILEAIIDPNKVVSDQYAATVFAMKDGSSIVGRLVGEDEDSYSISQNPFAPQVVREVSKSEVLSKKYSHISLMYPGLINPLNEEELRNLVAYLKSSETQ
jgi:putative heme-binding domain-containing protein